MKVLILTPGYPSDLDPTSGAFVREHARALKASHDVAVLCISGQAMSQPSPGKWQRSIEEGIEVWRTYLHHEQARPYILRFAMAALSGFLKLRPTFQPEVIHARFSLPTGFAAAVAGILSGLPTVITEDASCFAGYLDTYFHRLLLRWTMNRANQVVAVSHPLKETILASGIQVSIEVIGNSVDCTVFHPTPVRPSTNYLRVAFVGRMAKTKGIDILLHAVKAATARLKQPLRLSLIGDGPDLSAFQQLCQDMGLGDICLFLGSRPREEVAKILRESHFLILPSLEESFGIVLIEAMACGKPVIATRCGGPESFVTPETGLIVPPGDVEALAAALETMTDNLTDYDPQRIAVYARENFGYETVAARLTAIYESVQRDR